MTSIKSHGNLLLNVHWNLLMLNFITSVFFGTTNGFMNQPHQFGSSFMSLPSTTKPSTTNSEPAPPNTNTTAQQNKGFIPIPKLSSLIPGKTEPSSLSSSLSITGSLPFPSDIFSINKMFNLPLSSMKLFGSSQILISGFNLILSKGLFFTSPTEKSKSPSAPYDSNNNIIDINIGQDGDGPEILLKLIENIISFSPHRAHPFYMKRDSAGLDPYALAGDIIAQLVIPITIAGAVESKGAGAPVVLLLFAFFIAIQKIVAFQIRMLIGYPYGDGTMTAGPALANLLAVQTAMISKYPTFLVKGFLSMSFGSGGICIFLSEGNTDSFRLFGILGGIPQNLFVRVKMDPDTGRMNVADLNSQILACQKRKRIPLIVIASIGSTTLGAIDPISEIVKLTEKYNIWLHIDGTHGGPILFSEKERGNKLLKGIEKSNSFTWSGSTMLGVPHPSSFLIVRSEGLLKSLWSVEKMYTYVSTHLFTSATTIASPKITDAMKTFFLFMIKGTRGLRQHVDYSFKLARSLAAKMKKIKNFKLKTNTIDSPVIAFNYLTPELLHKTAKDVTDYNSKLTSFTEMLHLRLFAQGFVYITLTRSRPDQAKHLIASTSNSILTEADLDYVVGKIHCIAQQIIKDKIGLCSNVSLQHVKALSPLASGGADYAPYVSAAMPDLHLPFFIDLFKLVTKKVFGSVVKGLSGGSGGGGVLGGLLSGGGNSKKEFNLYNGSWGGLGDAGDIGLREFGLKRKDILVYLDAFFESIFKFGDMAKVGTSLIKGLGSVNILGDLVTSALNPSSESSPSLKKIEAELIQTILKRLDYKPSDSDGAILDGNMANLYAIALAKQKFKKEADKNELVFYISDQAQSSWKHLAVTFGLGLESAIYIPSNHHNGQMNTTALKNQIEVSLKESKLPFLVVGTLGTPVFGAIDSMKEIHDIASQFKLWFHVDGLNDGGLIFSDKVIGKHNTVLGAGLKASDSFSFSSGKYFSDSVTSTFSIFVTKHKKLLKDVFGPEGKSDDKDKGNDNHPNKTNSKTASHRNETLNDDEESQDLGVGKTSSDDFKFYLTLKSDGIKKTNDRINSILENVKNAQKLMTSAKYNGGFQLLLKTFETTSICFNFVPNAYKSVTTDKPKDKSTLETLDKVQVKLASILVEKQRIGIIYTNSTLYEDGKYGFLKIDFITPEKKGVAELIEQIHSTGKDLKI